MCVVKRKEDKEVKQKSMIFHFDHSFSANKDQLEYYIRSIECAFGRLSTTGTNLPFSM